MIKDLCFEIIETCPNNCMFCSSLSSIHKKRMIDFETFSKTIIYLNNKYGLEEVSLSGGEPFLHPHLFDMVKLCKDLGLRVVLFTSGITLKSENNPFINSPYSSISRESMRILKEIGLDKIVFDFQSEDHETYNKLMGNINTFQFVLNSICYAKFEGLDVDIHFIPNKLNYRNLEDVLEIAEIMEIPQVSLLNFVPQGRGRVNQNKLLLSEEELKELSGIYERVKDKYKTHIRLGIAFDGNNAHKCNAGMSKLDIKFDGTVLPCPAFKEIDIEDLRKYGVQDINIYRNLEDLKVFEGTRSYPLCKKVYGMKKTELS